MGERGGGSDTPAAEAGEYDPDGVGSGGGRDGDGGAGSQRLGGQRRRARRLRGCGQELGCRPQRHLRPPPPPSPFSDPTLQFL